MTSSYILKRLNDDPKQWTYSLPDSTLGGIEDRHMKINGNCHPDFMTIPIGRPTGAKLCVRRTEYSKSGSLRRIGDTQLLESEKKIRQNQGYHRGSVNMYDTTQDVPSQEWNPQYYSDRRAPFEQTNIRSDVWKIPIRYNGTGIKTLRTPTELRDKGKPYMEHALSFTPPDASNGMRGTPTWDDVKPPVKYDVTRLHQTYPLWKDEQEYMKRPYNADSAVTERIV